MGLRSIGRRFWGEPTQATGRPALDIWLATGMVLKVLVFVEGLVIASTLVSMLALWGQSQGLRGLIVAESAAIQTMCQPTK